MVPEFPGGLEKFGAYFSKTKISAFTTANVTGRVILQMIVEKDGSLTHFKVLRSGGKAMDKAYVERLRNSPRLKPGLLHDKSVRVLYSIPISINFASDE